MRDKYQVGQAGAVGPGSSASDMTFEQTLQRNGGSIDLVALAGELSLLRNALMEQATDREHYAVIGTIASAEREAENGNGRKVLDHLSQAGTWALDVATKIGVEVAGAAIKESLGMK